MNRHTNIATHDWDKDVSHDGLRMRLAMLKTRTENTTPILDDDDLEAAIDAAADRLSRGESPTTQDN
jgi:hypothetical protein